LAAAQYPVRHVEVISDGDDFVELGASLVASSAEHSDLDVVVEALERSPMVKAAGWTVSALN
jgi:putative Mg2+ transporter-C (MgtC) family protein